ncbi:6-phosphofructokinase [Dichotomicrobium thermohalophilum]|uniref:Pyrophosphate-dependent phosphofructokinase n=1 Tax=Dichotomicrobium thermohalophilum TaxID=933063 RepID=A0A397QBD1_9HYPH|nr:6-phosphofructokinase [Dichotomicrobium thermohalophilum]RIA56797.1 pyrophosphate-dependent phosphofructokinase [Dichotomicrobium thermohalophilum]
MHLGILTGGGDVPGLNAAIKAVTEQAAARGWSVTGLRRGWAGPLNIDPDNPETVNDWTLALTPDVVRDVDRAGGTFLHTSRTKPSATAVKDLPQHLRGKFAGEAEDKKVDCTDHVLRVLEHLKLDVLVAIGGDDTLSYASRLHAEGAPTMCIPKTMDNDVFGTDYCIGFSTCVNRGVELITRLRSPADSHERVMVVEMFGRYSGESALITGYLAGVDRILIAEVPFDSDKVARLLAEDRARNPQHYAVIVVSEGAHFEGGSIVESGPADAYGHRKLGGIGQDVGEVIKRHGINVMNQNLAYLLRAGMPDAMDLMVGRNFGTMAVQLLDEGKRGLMMAIEDGRYTTQPADISTKGRRLVDVDMFYDPDQYRARIKRVEGLPMFLK